MRALLLIHRYLGIIGGALMVCWCLSGFVMMYVSYPELTEPERVASLAPIDWSACKGAPNALPADATAGFRIEMLAGRPVLVDDHLPHPVLSDLCSGAPLAKVTPVVAASAAAAYLSGSAPRLAGSIVGDPWTVSGRFSADRPLYHFVAGDDEGTEVYVSSASGRVVQVTRREQRFWNWLGAIPHWLYLYELRRHPEQWAQVVIVASLLGCFLTLTGLYLSLRRLRVLPRLVAATPQSPRVWHSLSGFVFGLFTLSWVASGLMSMQPWGLLDSSALDTKRLQGPSPSAARWQAALRSLSVRLAGSQFVSVESHWSDGAPFFVARSPDGHGHRLDGEGRAALPDERDWSALAHRLGCSPATLLTHEDAYLFAHHDETVALPAYRVALGDPAHHTLYFDATTGLLQAQFDQTARAHRWVEGLHRVDLLPVLRRRPLWDSLVIVLLSGVSVVCLTGAWLAYRSLFVRER